MFVKFRVIKPKTFQIRKSSMAAIFSCRHSHCRTYKYCLQDLHAIIEQQENKQTHMSETIGLRGKNHEFQAL